MYENLCKRLVNDFIANPDAGLGCEWGVSARALPASGTLEGVESARLSDDREGSHGSLHCEGICCWCDYPIDKTGEQGVWRRLLLRGGHATDLEQLSSLQSRRNGDPRVCPEAPGPFRGQVPSVGESAWVTAGEMMCSSRGREVGLRSSIHSRMPSVEKRRVFAQNFNQLSAVQITHIVECVTKECPNAIETVR